MGNNFTTTYLPYYVPTFGLNYGTSAPAVKTLSEEEEIEKKRKEEAERINKAVEEDMKLFEFCLFKEEQKDKINFITDMQNQNQKSIEQINGSRRKDGSVRIDSGEKGWKRWLSNTGTFLWNFGRDFLGYDENGNQDIKKFGENCLKVGIGIGLLFVPGGAFALGALGVYGAIEGASKGFDDLKEAERKKDQAKIDAAQQDICGNIIIGVLSVFGLKGIGAGFRTSVATAGRASCAMQRAGVVGKTIEGISNFGRDITVNACKASLKPRANGLVPSFSKWKKWETKYQTKFTKYEENLNQQIQAIDDLIYRTTDNEKLALLLEQKNLLLKNSTELAKFKSLKAKTDIDKLVAENAKTSGQANIERLGNYQVTKVKNNGITSKHVEIGGQKISAKDFIKFKKQMVNIQKAYNKSFRDLVKARENMMRELAIDPVTNRAVLDEYIAGLPVKRKWLVRLVPKQRHWYYPFKLTKDMMIIGGKQPSYLGGTVVAPFINPAGNIAKTWSAPMHSGALLLTMEMSKEEADTQLAALNQSVEVFRSLKEQFDNAKTKEELAAAENAFNQVMASMQGSQTSDAA